MKKKRLHLKGVLLLAGVFVVLKLLGVIAWSWSWVLSPLWIYAIAIIISLLVMRVVTWLYTHI